MTELASSVSWEFAASRNEVISGHGRINASDGDSLLAGGVEETPDATLMIAAPGDLRRIDLWITTRALISHGYRNDVDEQARGSVHVGRTAAFAGLNGLMGLGFESHRGNEVIESSTTETRFVDVNALLEATLRGTLPFHGAAAWVLHTRVATESDRVVAVIPEYGVWGSGAPTDELRMWPGRTAGLGLVLLELMAPVR